MKYFVLWRFGFRFAAVWHVDDLWRYRFVGYCGRRGESFCGQANRGDSWSRGRFPRLRHALGVRRCAVPHVDSRCLS